MVVILDVFVATLLRVMMLVLGVVPIAAVMMLVLGVVPICAVMMLVRRIVPVVSMMMLVLARVRVLAMMMLMITRVRPRGRAGTEHEREEHDDEGPEGKRQNGSKHGERFSVVSMGEEIDRSIVASMQATPWRAD